jgi:excisionase family DNA binding protein
MNREQAAKRLKISVRSLQRAVQAGKISVKYQRGKSGKQEAVFDPEEIERYKQELEQVTEREPTPPTQSTALATIQDKERLTQFVALVAETVRETMPQQSPAKAETTITDLAAKPLLTRAEAQRYTGLSQEILREAVEAGKLKEKLIGKSYRIKRADLDRFIEKLF